jgi:hypothetical protein
MRRPANRAPESAFDIDRTETLFVHTLDEDVRTNCAFCENVLLQFGAQLRREVEDLASLIRF